MAATTAVASEIVNALLGLTGLSTGIGFTVAEKDKMDELETKTKKLKEAATTAGTLYDDYYYVVSVNLNRVKKALEKIPTDMLTNIDVEVTSDLENQSNTEEAIQTIASVLGYGEESVKVFADLSKVVGYLRFRKGRNDYVPLEEENSITIPGTEDSSSAAKPVPETSSLPNTPKMDRWVSGLTLVGLAFGALGLIATIAVSAWTLDKLKAAIKSVDSKQAQIDAFQTAMTEVLNEVATTAELDENDFDDLVTLAATWKVIAEDLESYEKALYYAIKAYYEGKSDEETQTIIDAQIDDGATFPDDGYSLAKALADAIKEQFDLGKTDNEMVEYFANEHPVEGQRFVFDEYFISSLR